MFRNCSSLSNIKGLEKWDVTNGNNFSYIFSNSPLSDIKGQKNGMYQIVKIFNLCSISVHHYQILKD